MDEIIARLERGETLMIDGQWRSYITKEGSDFVVRGIYWRKDYAFRTMGVEPAYDQLDRHESLVEALLSLTDYRWMDQSKSAERP